MPLPILLTECLGNILLYKCLFVNRYYCKITIPMIWRDPFNKKISIPINCSLIKALLACLDEDEISSLIPSAINLNTRPPLFEYGEFIRKINHDCFVEHVRTLLESLNGNDNTDYEVQKLIDSIYNMIFRKSSVLQEFEINVTKKIMLTYQDFPFLRIMNLELEI
jgi:hypothetical protein